MMIGCIHERDPAARVWNFYGALGAVIPCS
jgi:hypothetical protein